MAEIVRVEAPAKINIHLRVYPRRDDGYHGILSLFLAVSLSDILVIRSLKEPNAIEIDGNLGCPAELSTVYKAVAAYREICGIRTGIAVSVEKRIPIGAGLGGGSSDAAATLQGMELLTKAGASADRIRDAALRIGSDVPFFLEGGAAIVSGRGEIIDPIPARKDFTIVIVFPGVSVGTREAYDLLDRDRPDDSSEPDPDAGRLETMYREAPEEWSFVNSFEPVIFAAHPEIRSARDELAGLGSAFAAMSGSGSSVFGVFRDESDAGLARDAMLGKGYRAFLAAPLARFPALV